jgi:hypothetical protein
MKTELGTDQELFHFFHEMAEVGRDITRMRERVKHHGYIPADKLDKMAIAYKNVGIRIASDGSKIKYQ